MTVIAIDGPAASGKSSVSRRLAKRLGFAYVNSGSLYRAITWEVLRQGVDTTCAESVAKALEHANIVCGIADNNESFIQINSGVPDATLRDSRVNLHVSPVSAVPAVRDLISARLRALARDRDVVMEGRDIGSAVFPETPYKFYLDASPEIRRKRRAAEGESDQIEARDKMDSSRKAAPLKIAGDAKVVDTSHLTLEGVVEAILDILRPLGLPRQ
ncbi:MAG: (d)CMP kinase [Terrimicrobiaceae bacterium]